MSNSFTTRGHFYEEATGRNSSLAIEPVNAGPIPKIFVVCDQRNTAPVWGYVLRHEGLIVILETLLEKAIEHWNSETTDLIVLDMDITQPARVDLYKGFRKLSATPILLLLPAYHETQILEAYAAGVDDVVVKPISPPIFLCKIMAWVRRARSLHTQGLNLVNAGMYQLDPARRYLIVPNGTEIHLTNLEFRLLHLLMSRPARVFGAKDIIDSIWGAFGDGGQILLKNVVYRVRRKIEEDPSHPVRLQTELGGYSFHG